VALLLSLLPLGGAWAQAFGSISWQQGASPSAQPASVALAALPVATLPAARAPAGNFDVADKVVVEKGQRRLYLLRQDQVIAEYPVKLGLNPYGPKQREGDFRTPEGSYRLVRRNPRSDFFLSIQVSYPSEQDLRRARSSGAKPGGLIMIHGEPNVPRKPSDYYAKNDWTDGCIAVSNADMVDIWLRTQAGIPIEIRP
jgi:murein L,D-transpeptidase YafK